MKVILENNVFNEAEELLLCVGVIESVLVYNGLNTVVVLHIKSYVTIPWQDSLSKNIGDGL